MIKDKIKNKPKGKTGKKEKDYIEGFNAVEWVREVRDKAYKANKEKNMKEYVKAILKEKK